MIRRSRLPNAVPAVIEMPDQRSVMKEFRALEQKRLARGLTPAEERRHAELRELVGPEPGAGGARSGFDVNAAAARLRESLLPAGLRNRPPPPPEVVEPEAISEVEPEQQPDPAAAAVASAYEAQPFAPLEAPLAEDAYFDPASLGGEGAATQPAAEGAWDPSAQPYDPNAQPYDPNAAWDPNAQPYDPNAPGQPWDAPADASFDPASLGTEPAPEAAEGWAAAEPAAVAAPAEPEAEPDFGPAPDSAAAGGDWSTLGAGAPPHEGDAWPAAEPGAELEDPYAMVPSAELLDVEPTPASMAAAAAEALPPEGWDALPPPAEPPGEVALGEYDSGALPFDAAAASAIDPAQLPEGFEAVPGEYDDNAGFGVTGYEAPPTAHLADDQGQDAAPAWQPEAAVDQGFALASGGSFDAAADAASPGWAGGSEPTTPWDGGGELTEAEPATDLGPVPELDRTAPDFSSGEAEGDDFFAVSAPPLALGGPAAVTPPPVSAPAPVAAPAKVVAAPPPAARARPPAPVARMAPAKMAAPPPAPQHEEIPTIDAEELVEAVEETAEAPPNLDFPAPEPFPPEPEAAGARTPIGPAIPPEDVPLEDAPALESSLVPGTHRVVIHTLEGLVKRGVLVDADLAAPVLGLAPQQGAQPEVLGADHVKAIFFMLAPGETAPAPEGKRVRVTFRDGRQVAGFSPDYREGGIGFFMIPADARTNTGRIWVYRAAVRQVSVS